MNNKFFNNHLLKVLLVAICGFVASCEDFVEVEVPNHKIVSQNVFNNDNTANSALIGIYNELFRSYWSGGGRNSISVLSELSADNLRSTILDNDLIEYEQNEISAQNTSNLNLWSSAYNIIYMCNSALDGLQISEGVSPEIKAKLMGEARFVRAFVYLYLVNLYGEVPLIQTSDYRINALAPRNNIDEIYSLIIYDLERAIEVLGGTYNNGERLRPNKFAAMALLARVYLYLEDWEKAEAFSSQVITSSENYALLNDLDTVFLANSKEAIWQVSPVGSGSALTHTKEGNLFILLENPKYNTPVSLSDHFVASFSVDDSRVNSWIQTFSSENETFYYPFKYKVKYASSGDIEEFSMVLRLAEQYLIRCEARSRQGKLPEAINDLDIIRERANLSLISNVAPGIDQKDLLDSIMIERRRELFTEWGHRWLDLKRSGKVSDILSSTKPSWQETDILYPIPEEEIGKNPNLTQNIGY